MKGRTRVGGMVICALVGLGVGWILGEGAGQAEAGANRPGTKSAGRRAKDLRPEAPAGVVSRVRRVDGLDGTGRKMKGAYALAMSVPVARIEEWLEGDYFDTSDSRVDDFFYQILYDRYLEADPEGFLSRCLRKDYDAALTTRYMKEWARRDPVAAREFLDGVVDRRQLETIAASVLASLVGTDREAAFALIGDLGSRMNDRGWGLQGGLYELAKGDPDGLLLAAQDWSPALREMALGQAGKAMLDRDFLGGVEWMVEHGGTSAMQRMSNLVGGERAFGVKILEFGDRLPEGWAEHIVASNAWSLVREDPARWLALDGKGMGLSDGSMQSIRRAALSQLVRKDWEAAAVVLEGDGGLSESERITLVRGLTSALGRKDRDGAEAWVAGLADADLRKSGTEVMDGVEDEVIVSNSMADKFLKRSGLVLLESARTYESRTWTRRESGMAIAAFSELGGEERVAMAQKLMANPHYLPFELGGEAVRFLMDSEGGEEDRNHRARAETSGVRLARSWAATDPAAAARWVESLPVGEGRERLGREVLQSWRLQAPEEARRWVEGLAGSGWEALRKGAPGE